MERAATQENFLRQEDEKKDSLHPLQVVLITSNDPKKNRYSMPPIAHTVYTDHTPLPRNAQISHNIFQSLKSCNVLLIV